MHKHNNTLVKVNEVSVRYGETLALEKATIDIHANDFIGVIGPNGGGKTTLIKAILGLVKPCEGNLEYNLSNHHNAIGYLPQINQFDKQFPISVNDVILGGLSGSKSLIAPYSKAEKQRAQSLMEQTGITHLAKKSIGNLSGGQMQRVFLCRALIAEPELLILDEPNTFVDNQFESELYESLKAFNKNMAIIMVSHDVGTISSYVKTIACVNKHLHYHHSNIISEEQLAAYDCPIQIITHGDVPHTVLKKHKH